MDFSQFKVTPLSGSFGAEISQIELAAELPDAAVKQLKQAWTRYKVLFFRDQHLTPDQQSKFAAHFGEFTQAGFMPSVDGYPHVWLQEYPALNDADVNDITWHIDAAFLPVPTRGSVLYALEVPDKGGDTVWADTEAAFEDLSDPMQAFLSGLTATHDNMYKNVWRIIEKQGGAYIDQVRQMMQPSTHPLIRTHPETGRKSLFVSELMTSHINELSREESDMLLNWLFRHVSKPEFQCRLKWRNHTVAMWDNRNTIHRAIMDFGDRHRLMHRISLNDDQPPV